MNEVRPTGSWLIIWLSALLLCALVWFSVAKQFENGIQGAFSALLDPLSGEKALVTSTSGELKADEAGVLSNSTRSPTFTLDISGRLTEAHAELPKGKLSQSVWESLHARSDIGRLKVQIEEYVSASGTEAEWLAKLPEFVRNLPEQTENSDLHLIITDEKSTILGKIGSVEEMDKLTSALREIAPDKDISTESLKVSTAERPTLSIEKNGSVLELKGQLSKEYHDDDFAGELKQLTGASELIDSVRYSPEILTAAKELENIGALTELLASNGSRSVVDFNEQQYDIKLFGYPGDNSDNLRTQIADLLGNTPFELAVGQVGSKELMTLPETQAAKVQPKEKREILAVNFGFNSYTLTQESEPALSTLLERMWANPDLRLVIEGHTDSVGSPVSNQLLSQQRADAVKNYLVESGISTTRLKALGFGDDKPISSNETSDGRFKNRRIEVREEQNS